MGRTGRRRGVLAAGLVAVALTGCGDGGDAAETPTPEAGGEPAESGGATELTLVAENVAFDRAELSVPAGAEVTITFDNRDAFQHNLRVLGLPEEAATAIETGPIEQTLTFTPSEAGELTYQCDVHPAQMTGTLTVTG